MEKYQHYIDLITDWAIRFTPKLILAIIILFIGLWIAKRISKLIGISMDKANITSEVKSFVGSIMDIVLKAIVILLAAATIGFEISSLIGIFAAVAFAVGMALQGFLGNFAAGITIVFFKPYKVGDWVEISEKFGKVESIQIFNTIIITPGEKTLVIPNGQVTDNIITNFSSRGHIRLELKVTMPYAESFPKVKSTIMEALKEAPDILHDPAPEIGIIDFDSHSITVAVWPFIEPDDYWDVTFDLNRRIKNAFSKNKIQVAYSEGVELGAIGD